MSELPSLHDKLKKFLDHLVRNISSNYGLLFIIDLSSSLKLFLITPWCICQQQDNNDPDKYASQIINVLQDIMEIITQDVMINGHE